MRRSIARASVLGMLALVSARAETFGEWQRSLAEHIRCRLVYPRGPGRPASPRTALVVFRIGADGALSNVNVERSSGVMVFDRAALAAVETANPGPPPSLPNGLPITVRVPLTFHPPRDGDAPQAETPRPGTSTNDPPVCKDVGIM